MVYVVKNRLQFSTAGLDRIIGKNGWVDFGLAVPPRDRHDRSVPVHTGPVVRLDASTSSVEFNTVGLPPREWTDAMARAGIWFVLHSYPDEDGLVRTVLSDGNGLDEAYQTPLDPETTWEQAMEKAVRIARQGGGRDAPGAQAATPDAR